MLMKSWRPENPGGIANGTDTMGHIRPHVKNRTEK